MPRFSRFTYRLPAVVLFPLLRAVRLVSNHVGGPFVLKKQARFLLAKLSPKLLGTFPRGDASLEPGGLRSSKQISGQQDYRFSIVFLHPALPPSTSKAAADISLKFNQKT